MQMPIADLPTGRGVSFDVVFGADQLKRGTDILNIAKLQKTRFSGRLTPNGTKDWALDGAIGASVILICVATLAPFKTRIELDVRRLFLSDWQEPGNDSVIEMDQDVDSESLGEIMDLENVAIEAISLALPDYPRSPEAVLEQTEFSMAGVTAMTDDDAKPFAGLAALKKKMDKSHEQKE